MSASGRRPGLAALLAFVVVAAGAALLLLLLRPDGEETDVRRAGPLSDRVEVRFPEPGERILSPLVVAGEAPGGWHFEATFPLRLLSADERTLADSFATARGEWMTEDQVPFRGVLRFHDAASGDGVLVLERSNASGLPEHDSSVRIPVRLAGAEAARVYFPNSVLDPEAADCRSVHPVVRHTAAGSGGGEEAALRLLTALLAGPGPAERAAGYHTALPEGVSVRSVAADDGTLRVDFDRSLSEGVAGSCRVQAIRAQIDSTLARLPGVRRVVISVEGRTEEALQP